ncbi:hypothetical protein AB0N38_18975 [Micromonospora aurantiaca]|uniref:hypothetical protein n=1 Tax=Micromonospora aurantiaca (nom. illeg.) TaxID=47850 RepID=UPI00343E17AC
MIDDWTVTDALGQTRTFTDKGPACAYAVRNARADRATVVTAPDGERTLVLRVDPAVEIHAVRRLTGGGTTQ